MPEKKSTETQSESIVILDSKSVKKEKPVVTTDPNSPVLLEGDIKTTQRKKWVEILKNNARSVSVSLNLPRVFGNIPSDQQGVYFKEYNLWVYPDHGVFGFGDPREEKKQEHTVVIALEGERAQGKIVQIKDEIWVCRGGNFTVGRPRKANVFWEVYKGTTLKVGKNQFSKVCQIEDSSKMFDQIVSYVKEIDRIRKMWTSQNQAK